MMNADQAGQPLGFQPSGASYGGQGGSPMSMFMRLMSYGAAGKGKTAPQAPPTASQMTALDAGAGPVNASTANAILPVGDGGAPAPANGSPYGINPYQNNPYYHIGYGALD